MEYDIASTVGSMFLYHPRTCALPLSEHPGEQIAQHTLNDRRRTLLLQKITDRVTQQVATTAQMSWGNKRSADVSTRPIIKFPMSP